MNCDREKLLLVSARPEPAESLLAVFADAQYAVEVCVDLAGARRTIGAQGPDCVLIDAALLDVPGLAALDQLRAAAPLPRAPRLVLFGAAPEMDTAPVFARGVDEILPEPVQPGDALARVRRLLAWWQATRRLDALNTQLAEYLVQKTSHLELMYGFARALNMARDVERIYDIIIETVQSVTACRRISILRFDPSSGALVCKRAVGMPRSVAEELAVHPAEGIAGQVFTSGRAVVSAGPEPGKPQDGGYVSAAYLSTPLLATYMTNLDQPLGVLNVTDKPDGTAFTSDEIEVICSIGVSAGIALHNVEHERDLQRSIRALLLTVGRLSEYRDEDTGLHLERVRDYAQVLARGLKADTPYADQITPEFIDDLHMAAPLHDLGKIAIPDEILNKPGRLTPEEFQIMKTHTTVGRHTLNLAIKETGPLPLLRMCAEIAYSHHERWDGKGYPCGLTGTEIPLAARIIGLVDAYDAITSQRCYKPAVDHEQAVRMIRQEAGRHFDPLIVEAFLKVEQEFNRIRVVKADDSAHQLVSAG